MKQKVIESLTNAVQSAAEEDYQQMYSELWDAMNAVPDDATVMWEFEQTLHEPTPSGIKVNDGCGGSPDPIDLIQSVMYGNNDLGTDYIHIQPEGYDD